MQDGSNLEARLDGTLCYQGWYHGGEVGIIPQGISHWVVWDRPIDLTLIFPHESLLEKVALEIVKGSRTELIPTQAAGDLALTQLGLLLKADLEAAESSGKLYRDSIAIALVTRLLKHHAVCHIKSLNSVKKLSNQQLNILLSYIQDHLEQDIRLVDLASQINLSESYLCHLFKQSIGISPYQYVIQQRVERAKILLKQSGRTVTTIALECGFASQSHLAKYFRHHTGMNPNQFRKH
jgi:AraC family transcriptional regulator